MTTPAPQTPTLLGGSIDGTGLAASIRALKVNADGSFVLEGTLSIDSTGLATSAKQDTAQTSLSAIAVSEAAIAASAVLLQQPTRIAAVTKSDSTDITATATKGLWIGGGGDVAVKGAGDSVAVTISAVPAGTYLPGAYKAVMSTNTTATLIVSFYGP